MKSLHIPPAIRRAIASNAAVALSVSGGKDGQAMVEAFMAAYQAQGWTCTVFLIHADLGRAEWHESLAMCRRFGEQHTLDLVVVRRPQGGLVERIEQRLAATAGTGKPFWPSAASRYCTGELKRDQINKELRRFDLVISVEGLRGQESTTRARKRPLSIRSGITAKRYQGLEPDRALEAFLAGGRSGRLAFTWYPLLDWQLDDVRQACGTSQAKLDRRRVIYWLARELRAEGNTAVAVALERLALDGWPCHPAYVYGNQRVSCVFCVLAGANDLAVGAEHRPELLAEYIQLEQRGGATFKANAGLAELVAGEAAACAFQETAGPQPVQLCLFGC